MKKTRNYDKYEDYTKYQLTKTSDKTKIKKWQNEEWQVKIDCFKKLFKVHTSDINKSNKILCLGSRTGQEVVAFQSFGKDKEVIGIDLHEFKPYTIVGDIHNLQFEDNYFDIEFTNIFDHSIYPEKFISEVHRTLKSGGIFILHFQYKINQDKYTETIITDIDKFKVLLKDKFEIISDNKLPSNITAMNYEIKLKKTK